MNGNNVNDKQAWYRHLFEALYEPLVRYALMFVGNTHEAEDVVEDTFCDLWHQCDNLDNTGATIKAYLYRGVGMRALNVLRHRKVAETRIELLDNIHQQISHQSVDIPDTLLENRQLQQILEQAIANLPDKCGEVFSMSYIQGLKNKEIATELGLSVRTVEAHIYKALKLLRAHLAPLSRP